MLCEGVLGEPSFSGGRAETLSDAGDSGHRVVRVVEDGALQKLSSQRVDRTGRQSAIPTASLVPSVSCAGLVLNF